MNAVDLHQLVMQVAAGDVVAPPTPLNFSNLDDAQWERLATAVRAERLEPQLARSVAASTNGATPWQVEQSRTLHARSMATTLLLDRQLLEVATILDRGAV